MGALAAPHRAITWLLFGLLPVGNSFGVEPVPVFNWAAQAGGPLPDAAEAVVTDADGNLYVAGSFGGTAKFGNISLTTTAGTYDLFVAKFQASGGLLWVKDILPNSLAGDGKFLAVDGAGNILLAATVVPTVVNQGFSQLFLTKLSPAGTVIWSETRHGTGFMDLHAGGLALDATGNILVTGTFTGTADFGGTSMTSLGYGDVYVAKFTTAGALSWVRQEGQASAAEDAAHGLVVDDLGNVYVAAEFGGTISVGTTKLTSANSTALLEWDRLDLLLVKYDAGGTRLWARAPAAPGKITPGRWHGTPPATCICWRPSQARPPSEPDGAGRRPQHPSPCSFRRQRQFPVGEPGQSHRPEFRCQLRLYQCGRSRGAGGRWKGSHQVFRNRRFALATRARRSLPEQRHCLPWNQRISVRTVDDPFTLDGATLTPSGAGDAYIAKAVLTTNGVPVLTTQPVGAVAVPGAQVTFSVTATGVEPISYQWRRNGVNLPGGITPSYRVAPVLAIPAAITRWW